MWSPHIYVYAVVPLQMVLTIVILPHHRDVRYGPVMWGFSPVRGIEVYDFCMVAVM